MRSVIASIALLSALPLAACGEAPTDPSPPATTTTTAAVSPFEIKTLLTVYTSNMDDAQFTEGTTRETRIGMILLGVDTLTEGTTNLNNEGARLSLQASVNRVNAQFMPADFRSAFGETRENLERFLNDADADGWAIDGRHGLGRDWPYDANGNDPDGWTAQMIVTVTRR
jgi:hypothetical protein